MRALAAIVLAVSAGTATADSFDLNLHDDALRLTYSTGMNGMRGLSVDGGILYQEDTANLYHVGLSVSGENWSKAGVFDISIGGRAIYSSPEHVGDAAAVGLGGRVRFSPAHRVGIGGHLYYAPNILSFADSERYVEMGVRLDYQLLPQAFVYVGWRSVEIRFENHGDVELDESGHVGMKLLF